SLEDTNSGTGATGANGEDSSDHYAPDVVGGLGYKAGAWGFKVVGGYDSIVEEGAIKARVDADFGVFSAFVMGGWNTDGDKLNKYAGANGGGDASGIGWGDWAVWGGASVPINEKLKWNFQVAYTDSKIFSATTNLKFNPVKNLLVEPEVTYTNWDSINEDQWAGILRFERSF
ncbi:porin, partial [Rhizobium rhizogenes]